MVSMHRRLVWDYSAKDYLKKSIQYIKLDSPQNALKVSDAIKASASAILNQPERYQPDKYRINNTDNAYRAFVIYNFRISYHISELEIRIVRVRHAKQDSVFY